MDQNQIMIDMMKATLGEQAFQIMSLAAQLRVANAKAEKVDAKEQSGQDSASTEADDAGSKATV